MKNVLTISTMGICSSILVAGVLAACGGGSSGAGPTAPEAAVPSSSVDAQAAETQTSDSSSAEPTDPRSAPAILEETTAALNGTRALLMSLLSVGATASDTEQGTTVDTVGSADSATSGNTAITSELVADASSSTAATTTVTALSTSSAKTYYVHLANEFEYFLVPNNTVVRYGVAGGTNWVTKTVSGHAECTNEFFLLNPANGIVKVCEAVTTNAALAAAAAPIWSKPSGQMPVIDLTKIPVPWSGFSTARLGTNATPILRQDIGAFRTECGPAKMSFDDPILYPGQPGKSHLHTFFGNTGTNASSTSASLRTTGNSTCAGGIANRTAYWVPSLIDTQTGAPVVVNGVGVYYKSGYDLPPSIIKPIPAGLRMVAGNAAGNTSAYNNGRFSCVGGPNNENDKVGQSIGNCDVGAELVQSIAFPQCWDGVNLDSPDHKSHMAYPSGGACPSSHPVAIPAISFNVTYTVWVKDAPLHWRLSSDNYDPKLPAGYSNHADWFNGWQGDISDTWEKIALWPSRIATRTFLAMAAPSSATNDGGAGDFWVSLPSPHLGKAASR